MVITMSRKELMPLRVLIDVADGRLSVADATGLIGVSRRQIYRFTGYRPTAQGRPHASIQREDINGRPIRDSNVTVQLDQPIGSRRTSHNPIAPRNRGRSTHAAGQRE
jgi:hypothetical protein